MIKLPRYDTDIQFPSRDRNPATKGAEYCTKWCEGIYSLWLRGKTAWGYGDTSYFKEMRMFAAGNQGTDQYKSFLTGLNPTDTDVLTGDNAFTKKAKREGWYNLLWENLSPASKIMNSLHGMLDKFDFDIYADTIDSDSRGLIEFTKYKKFFEAKEQQFINDFKQKAGIPIDEDVNFPSSKEELDAFEAREGFKLNIAKAMQKLTRYTFNVSKWDSVIRKKVLDDLICTGYGTTADYYDSEDCLFKTMWLDPERTVMQASAEYDYCDSEYGGYFYLQTVSNLKRKLPEVDEEQWKSLAKSSMGELGNPQISAYDEKASKLDPATQSYLYDEWKVPVLWGTWIDTDTYKKLRYKGATGRESAKDIDYDYKPTPLTKKQKERGMEQSVDNVPLRVVYQGYWVVGTDLIYDYGKVNMAARPKETKPKLPIHAEQLLQPSIMQRLRPILNAIAITWLTHQNSIAKMVERGHAINMAMLMGITLGGKKLDPAEVLTMWKQTGFLPYMYNFNGQYSGGAATPITPIEGGLGNRIKETMDSLMMNFKLIEDIVGLNPLMLGATPDPNAPVGTSEAAMKATSNVLKPIMDATFELKASIAESIACRLQIGLRVSDDVRRSYSGVVKPADIKALVMAENSGVKYGIMLKERPSEARRQEVKMYLNSAVEQGLLPVTEAMFFSERLDMGEDIIEIRQQIAYTIQKENERKSQEQMANIQAQNEGLQQLEQQKAQNALQLLSAEGQVKTQEEVVRGQIKDSLLRKERNYDLMKDLLTLSAQEDGVQPNTSR